MTLDFRCSGEIASQCDDRSPAELLVAVLPFDDAGLSVWDFWFRFAWESCVP